MAETPNLREQGVCRSAAQVVERIMTAHDDVTPCACWVCATGRSLGLRTRYEYELYKGDNATRYPMDVLRNGTP